MRLRRGERGKWQRARERILYVCTYRMHMLDAECKSKLEKSYPRAPDSVPEKYCHLKNCD